MDPVSIALVLGLVVKLTPALVDLVERLKSGHQITPAEIESTEALVKGSVDKWKAAGA